jgi:Xaa-Pro aminopeptidase
MRPRIEKLRERLAHFQLDALLITSPTNIRYLFGFTGSNAIALVTSEQSFFVTDRRYIEQAKSQVRSAEILIGRQDLFAELKKVNVLRAGLKLGFEAMNLTAKNYFHLQKTFTGVKLIASERVIEKLASVKEPEEVACIKKAAEICGNVYREILAYLEPGIVELEISAEISYRTRRHGSERDPFEPIVASGWRSALPHGISSNKIVAGGDLVILDFGAVVNGYAADFTRTVVVGEPSEKQKDIAAVVQEALHVSAAAARPGMLGKNLDAVARGFLKQQCYGDFFQHSLGHGLGLDVHGLPRIGELSDDPLEAGNVIALEPGVYLPELGGVRIEDDFLVTETGLENLTPFPRELVCVG